MSDKSTLRVLTYNIFQPGKRGTQHERAERLASAPFLFSNSSGHQYDIVILNEIFGPNEDVNALLAALENGVTGHTGYSYRTPIVARQNDGAWDGMGGAVKPGAESGGVVVLSRHPIEKKIQHIYTAHSSAESNKGFAYARLDMRGSKVHVIATHLDSLARGVRERQLREIVTFLGSQGISDTDMVVIAGDLNVDRHGSEYPFMMDILEADEPCFQGPASWNPRLNNVCRVSYPEYVTPYPYVEHVDYVLLRPRAGIQQTTVNTTLPQALIEPFSLKEKGSLHVFRHASDHFPVEGTISATPL